MAHIHRDARGAGKNRGVSLLCLLLLAGAAASAACRGHEGSTGVGGQSGDEGRRPERTRWLGTGGVAAEPARP